MRELSTRSAGFTDSVIRRMTRVANKYGAVNLSQGFPDFDPPKEITDRLAEVAGIGPHQYALTWGAKNFRDALSAKYEHFSGIKVDPESEIVVTCGSTEAMMASMLAITNPGDKVIIFSPFYENYGADTILSGAEPIYVPLVPPEFNFDSDRLEAAVVGLQFDDSYYEGLAAHYAHMKELFVGGLDKLGLNYTDPQGAYYVLVDVSEFGVKDDVKFCEWMAEKVGVAAVPGSSFFAEDVNHLIRFHFAKKDETLNEALDRLSNLKKLAADYR